MRRSTILIAGGGLLVVVLLCAVLFAGWIAGRGGTSMGWEPRLDRDRHHFDVPTWDSWEGSRVGLYGVGLLGLVSCLVLAGALVLGGVLLARNRRPSPPAAAGPPELVELRGRYARGEISREEYLQRRDELSR